MHHCTAPAFGPRVSSFDDPAHWQYQKSCIDNCGGLRCRLGTMQCSDRAVTWTTNDFDTNMMSLFDIMRAFPAVRAVGIKFSQPRALDARLRNDGCGGIPILHTRGGYSDCNEQSHRINDEIALSPLDPLACIESAFAVLRRGASGLCIDHRCGWRTGASHSCTPLFTQPVLHLFKYAGANPA